ncbi:MAG: hypothetical protein U1E46_05295 [Hyphomicrobiales bacterium]|jgi:hypothetical protein
MTTVTADARFLRRILFGLIAATLIAGVGAAVTSVEAAPPVASLSN